MTKDKYEVYFSDGRKKEFIVNSAIEAWIRGLSYAVLVEKDISVEHVINLRSMQIFSEWEFDVTFSIGDSAMMTGTKLVYTEDEVRRLLADHSRFTGNNVELTNVWFDRNRKLK